MVLALVLSGCGRLNLNLGPLLRDVTVAPDQISPNADGDTDVTEIRYKLSRSAYISIFFENEDGDQFYFRKDRRRSPGSYRVQWGGVMDEPENRDRSKEALTRSSAAYWRTDDIPLGCAGHRRQRQHGNC